MHGHMNVNTITSYSEDVKQSFVAKMNECRVCFTVAHRLKIPVHKIILVSRYLSVAFVIHSCLTRT